MAKKADIENSYILEFDLHIQDKYRTSSGQAQDY